MRDRAAWGPTMSQDQTQGGSRTPPLAGRGTLSFKGVKCSRKKQMAETDDNIHIFLGWDRIKDRQWLPVEARKETNPRPQMSFKKMKNEHSFGPSSAKTLFTWWLVSWCHENTPSILTYGSPSLSDLSSEIPIHLWPDKRIGYYICKHARWNWTHPTEKGVR